LCKSVEVWGGGESEVSPNNNKGEGVYSYACQKSSPRGQLTKDLHPLVEPFWRQQQPYFNELRFAQKWEKTREEKVLHGET
jgi:hypothetical protein